VEGRGLSLRISAGSDAEGKGSGDERGVETEQGPAIEAPATERAGKRIGRSYTTAPRLDSTMPFDPLGIIVDRVLGSLIKPTRRPRGFQSARPGKPELPFRCC